MRFEFRQLVNNDNNNNNHDNNDDDYISLNEWFKYIFWNVQQYNQYNKTLVIW